MFDVHKMMSHMCGSLQLDFDMELLMWLVLHRKKNVDQTKLAYVRGALFTDDFPGSHSIATADGPDKPYNISVPKTQKLVGMHKLKAGGKPST